MPALADITIDVLARSGLLSSVGDAWIVASCLVFTGEMGVSFFAGASKSADFVDESHSVPGFSTFPGSGIDVLSGLEVDSHSTLLSEALIKLNKILAKRFFEAFNYKRRNIQKHNNLKNRNNQTCWCRPWTVN